MTNEEFQNVVINELKRVSDEVKRVSDEVKKVSDEVKELKEGQAYIRDDVKDLKQGQREIKQELKAISDQTVELTEFREETNFKLNTIIEENDILKELVGKHEVDIRRIKRRII